MVSCVAAIVKALVKSHHALVSLTMPREQVSCGAVIVKALV